MPVSQQYLKSLNPRTPCIYAVSRTPFCQYSLSGRAADKPGQRGALGGFSAAELGKLAIQDMFAGISGLNMSNLQAVTLGNVIMAGQGQAPARQAAVNAGIPESVPAHTVNKMCASGMATVVDAGRMIRLDEYDFVLAGGMESMSQAPFMLKETDRSLLIINARDEACVFPASDFVDAMMQDGLNDAWGGDPMYKYAQMLAEDQGYEKEALDDEAVLSYERAQAAIQSGTLAHQIASINTSAGTVSVDDEPANYTAESIRARAAIGGSGAISAANASSTDDGAAVLLIVSAQAALDFGLEILATVEGWADYGDEPCWFTKCPVGAANQLLNSHDLGTDDVNGWEVNEAFAAVSYFFKKELGLSDDIVNPYGGAVSVGHPVGASGGRIIMNLINALEQRGGGRGVASICYGGGGALATMLKVA